MTAEDASDQVPETGLARYTLLASMRHELRTPINHIIGYSEMLQEEADDQGQKSLIPDLQRIQTAGHQLLTLINEYLDPSKIETGEIRVSRLRHELRTPLNAIIGYSEMMQEEVEEQGQKDLIPDLKKICTAAQHLLAVINDSLAFSWVEADEIAAPNRAYSTPTTSRDVVSIVWAQEDTNDHSSRTAPGNVLVVDDNEMNRDLLTRRLAREGHTVAVAEHGRHALEMMKENNFDLVLLDIMMPEMDGFQVLEHLKIDDTLRHTPVIVLSSLNELDSVVRCIEMGAEDYLPKPFNPVLLRARVGACLEKKRLRDREVLFLQRIEAELEVGRRIQAGLFPQSLPQPPGWEIVAMFQSARQVAGDFYDAFPLGSSGRIALVVADVCDKGVGAALFMSLFRTLLRAFADQRFSMESLHTLSAGGDQSATDVSDALKSTILLTNNYVANTHGQSNMFATIFFGALDPATGSLLYINGGHDAPAIVSPGGSIARLVPTGPAVGMLPDMEFSVGQARLDPGDILIGFTDGVTDAHNPVGEFFTEERLLEIITQPSTSADETLNNIVSSLQSHIAGAEPFDDITLLAVRRAPQSDGLAPRRLTRINVFPSSVA